MIGFRHRLWHGFLDASAELWDGYDRAPGNCEIIARQIDFARRVQHDLPVVLPWDRVPELPVGVPVVGLWHHAWGDNDADDVHIAPMALQAARVLGVPLYWYRDRARWEGPDGAVPMLQSYPAPGEPLDVAYARLHAEAARVGAGAQIRLACRLVQIHTFERVIEWQPYATALANTFEFTLDAAFCWFPAERGSPLANSALRATVVALGETAKAPREETDMEIGYGPMFPAFTHANLIAMGENLYAVKKDNGKFLSVQPDGTYQERDSPGGSYEIAPLSDKGLVFSDPAYGGKVWIVPIVTL